MKELHDFIVNSPQFRKDTNLKSEGQIQTEIRPLIIQYLEKHFKERGYKDYTAKANQSFYWKDKKVDLDVITLQLSVQEIIQISLSPHHI